ncbi:hypothetical protein BC829DRAFT_390804 [Chytridium lagenaria]|nr:hypothetical protein BC829DRAFT_390804 [Chytridium lagenaria]
MSSIIIALTLATLATSALARVYPDNCHVLVNPTVIGRTSGSVGPFFHDHAFVTYNNDSGLVVGFTSQTSSPTAAYDNHNHTVTSGQLYLDASGALTTIKTENGLCVAVVAGNLVTETCSEDARQLFEVEAFKQAKYLRSAAKLYLSVGTSFEGPLILGKRAFVYSMWDITPCNSILMDAVTV